MGDNPFDDLGAPAGEDQSATESEQTESTDSPADPEGPAAPEEPEVTTADTAADESTADESTTESDAGPAFPYDEVKQRPLYAREEAWAAFEDALELDVERILRENEVRDAEGREFHDAALRVAAEHPEEIAEQMLDARGIDHE